MRPVLWLVPCILLCAVPALGPVAACPCMDGLPAMQHNPLGDPTPELPPAAEGCEPTTSSTVAPGGLREVLHATFDDAATTPWTTFPAAGPTGLRLDAATKSLVVDPGNGTARRTWLAPARLDAETWEASLVFRLGRASAGATDPKGTASFTVQFATVDPTMVVARPALGLRVDIDNAGGTGYPVTGTGYTIHDGLPHTLAFAQAKGSLNVSLDGTLLGTGPAIGQADECVQLGISGAATATTQFATIDDVRATTVPNVRGLALAAYGFAEPPTPVVAAVDATPVPPACAPGTAACCLADNMPQGQCVVQCTTAPAVTALPDGEAPPNLQAARQLLAKTGCDRATPATHWPAWPGRNDVVDSPRIPDVKGATVLVYTDTDRVMYDAAGNTIFTCDRIGNLLFLEMAYTHDSLLSARVPETDVHIWHWDGHDLRRVDEVGSRHTALGNLTTVAAGRDVANRTVWAVVKVEDRVEGRVLNNNFATVKRSGGGVAGNGYVLGSYDPATGIPSPSAAWLVLALAGVAVALRRRHVRP